MLVESMSVGLISHDLELLSVFIPMRRKILINRVNTIKVVKRLIVKDWFYIFYNFLNGFILYCFTISSTDLLHIVYNFLNGFISYCFTISLTDLLHIV